jgi:hypothetical protein
MSGGRRAPGVIVAALLVACAPRLELGAPCVRPSDCPVPLTCLLGACRTECLSDRDCGPGLACVAMGGQGACTLDRESSCSGVCDPPLVCVEERCRGGCTSDAECLAAQTCDRGSCRDRLDAGAPEDAGSTDAGFEAPVPCTTSCPDGQVCATDYGPRVCRVACSSHAECGPDGACDFYPADVDGGFVYACASRCVPGTDPGCAPGTTCRATFRSGSPIPGGPDIIPICSTFITGRGHGCACTDTDGSTDCDRGTACEPATPGRQCLTLCALPSMCADGQECQLGSRPLTVGSVVYGICPPSGAPRSCP